MSPRRLLSLPVPALIITLATAVSAEAPSATTSHSASDPNILANQCIIEMAAKLPEEIIITKIQTSKTKFDLPTPEMDNARVSEPPGLLCGIGIGLISSWVGNSSKACQPP
jgi:hypothetical protein